MNANEGRFVPISVPAKKGGRMRVDYGFFAGTTLNTVRLVAWQVNPSVA
jgi:hypothetical protein